MREDRFATNKVCAVLCCSLARLAHSAASRDDVLVGRAPVATEERVWVRVGSMHRSLVAENYEASFSTGVARIYKISGDKLL